MNKQVSIVVPFFNERENVVPLYEKIVEVMNKLEGYEFECVFVNDGSTDGTREILEDLAKKDNKVRVFHMRRNSGQSAAIVAGMRQARGEFLLMLDGDLQNDPQDFPKMLELLESYDCVFGYRKKRKDSFIKRIASRIANRVRRWWLDDDIRDAGCGTKGFRRKCVAYMIPFNGMHRYFGVFMKAAGMKIIEIEVSHHPRKFGTSKYGIWDRFWRGLYDLIGVAWLRRRYVPIELEGDK